MNNFNIKQISNYHDLVSDILSINHDDNLNRHYNQIPYNNYVWDRYVKPFLISYKGAEVSKEVKILIENINKVRDINDYRILETINKLKEFIFSKNQIDLMLNSIKRLTKRGNEKEDIIKKRFQEKFGIEFLDVRIDEDKRGIDLKDSTNKTYQIKSVSNVYDPVDKNYVIITTYCDMKVADDLDYLIIENNNNLWLFRYKEHINKFENKEDNKFMISYKKVTKIDLNINTENSE